jgi:hypothetical protein
VRASEAAAILVLVESALFLAPLLPAFGELRRKRDARPLEVIQKYSGDIAHFARGFRSYVALLQEPLRQCVETRTTGRGRLKNGEEYVLLGDDRQAFANAVNVRGSTCRWLIAAGIDVTLPNDLNFAKEVYAAKSVVSGERNSFRAILCDQDIHLRQDGETMRWAHAGGQFRVDARCNLYGRASSDREIVLAKDCTFQRLHAPRIVLGSACCEKAESTVVAATEINCEPAALLGRRLIEGDVEVRPGERVGENIVARGRLHIGAGARMLGSVKGHKSVVLDGGVEVAGSVISSGELRLGPGCQIGGPVLAEHQIEIASGTVCGTPNLPTTVSSPLIEATEGTVFFGTMWARETGRVVART